MSKEQLSKEIVKEYKEITLLKNPILTITFLIKILSEQLVHFLNYLSSHKITLFFVFVYVFMIFVPGPFKEVNYRINKAN